MGTNKLSKAFCDPLPDQVVAQRGRWLHQKSSFIKLIMNAFLFRKHLKFRKCQPGNGAHGSYRGKLSHYVKTFQRDFSMKMPFMCLIPSSAITCLYFINILPNIH